MKRVMMMAALVLCSGLVYAETAIKQLGAPAVPVLVPGAGAAVAEFTADSKRTVLATPMEFIVKPGEGVGRLKLKMTVPQVEKLFGRDYVEISQWTFALFV